MYIYIIILSLTTIFYSSLCGANDTNKITFGYDKINSEIYATNGNIKKTLKFDIDYTGNPSYYFDFFSDSPAIVTDGRSLHDFTTYTTLNFNNHDIYVDCFYYNIKSKQNGILVKDGVCGLNKIISVNYAKYIEGMITDVEKEIDTLDTSPLLNGKIKYLPVVINNNTNRLVYKLYENKTAFLNDDFSVLIIGNDGVCETYTDSPWVITKGSGPSQQIEIKSETIKNGKASLIKTLPKNIKTNKCLLFPAFRVNVHKAFFYDTFFNVKRSYLIMNDKINLHSMSDDGKWCSVSYINSKNKIIRGNMLCSELIL